MTNIIDWSDEKPNRNNLGQYVQNVQNAPPKTKFVYHVGPSGTNSICSSKLGYYAARLAESNQHEHQVWAKRLSDLKALCDGAIARQAEAVWRAPERMAV